MLAVNSPNRLSVDRCWITDPLTNHGGYFKRLRDPIATATSGRSAMSERDHDAAAVRRQGLPKIDPIMKGRFWPAVEAFFRNRHGMGNLIASEPDGEERWDVT